MSRLQKEGQKSLLIVLLLAAGLRFAGITFDSLWLDESYQTLASSVGQRLPDFTARVDQPFLFRFEPPRPLPELLSHFRQVDPLCPPMYPLILNRWMALFGDSDLAIRSLSALLSTLSVAAVFWCARLLFGPGPALAAALLQSVSPFDIHYGQEARMYSLAILLSALSCGSFFTLLRASRITSRTCFATATYAVFTWALINTHYTALFVAIFQGLFGLWICFSQRRWRLLGILSIAWVSVLVLWLPWFDMFRQAAAVRSGTFYVARQPSWWWPAWALLVRIPLNWIVFLAGKKVVAYAVPIYLTSACFLASALLATLSPWWRQRLSKLVPASADWRGFPGGRAESAVEGSSNAGARCEDTGPFPGGGFGSFPGAGGDPAPAAGGATTAREQDGSARMIEDRGSDSGDSPASQQEVQLTGMLVPGLGNIVHVPRAAAFVWCWALLPAVFVWLVDVFENHRVIEISRYVSATAPAIYVLAGMGLSGMGTLFAARSRQLLAARIILTAHIVFTLINNLHDHLTPQREPWREMAAAVEARCLPDQLILVSQYYDIACLDRYLSKPMLQVGVSPAQGQDHISSVVSGRDQFWLVTAQEGEAITGMIPSQFKCQQELNLSHGLHLRQYRKL